MAKVADAPDPTDVADRLTPRAREIVAAARELLEESGPALLTMRTLADRLGIKAPSLYKHFPDKHAVEVELTALMLEESAAALEAAEPAESAQGAESLESAGSRTPGSLEALAGAYRAYALAHPHLYCLATERPLPRTLLPAGLEDRAALPLLRACGGDQDLARATWAFAHGMVVLEIHGRFPEDADLDAAWKRGLKSLHP
ncbi:TetR/AcrR family transcriptional regulator [Streptomyces sp. NPDC094038]|uniref:TetR/AcrR family transcriptional regulator n=1 Tax=Streptomyces sp. NPDC094038 TaxID=3366055 RepID=UPI00381DF836